jgi:hypothetical protein
MYRKGYTVHDNITDDQLAEFVKKDPDYKRTHTAVITGYQPVIGPDGKQKEIDGKLVEQPLWSIIDMKPGTGEPVTLDSDSAKRLKSAGLGDYQAGQILPGTVAREQLGQADKIHTALGFISEQKLSEIPNDVKDQLATVVAKPEVFHALSMFKGNPIGGLHVAQQALAKEAQDLTVQRDAMAKNQGPGVQENVDAIQKKIDDVKGDADAVDKVMTLGFDDKEKAEYWKEQDAAKKEDEAAKERARTQAETERHNRATEIFKAAEAGSPEQIREASSMLVNAEEDPSQLSKRAKTYQATLDDAKKMSWETYGKPWSAADAQTEYKYANQKSTQDTLKMIDGMTDPGGAFDIAMAAARQLPGMDQQTINKLFNYGETEFGNKAQTDFHTAMVGFADEYSKVMGGGNPTDTLRKQGMDLMKDAYSKGQLEGASVVLKKDLAARQKAIVKNNRYLQRQVYGPQGMMVTMISPNGHRAEIPVSQRDAAIQAGAHVQTKAEYDQYLASQPK